MYHGIEYTCTMVHVYTCTLVLQYLSTRICMHMCMRAVHVYKHVSHLETTYMIHRVPPAAACDTIYFDFPDGDCLMYSSTQVLE